MSKHLLFLLLLALPWVSQAQSSAPLPNTAPFNAPTLEVLMANRPSHIEQAKWLEMMEQPVNRSGYPLRITQAMLDSLDGRLLDRRFQYVLVR
ncbi:MAG: hypothetical protein JNM31_15925 [Flavobacteriales bacterium]|nr:hypothetical protein [Flavobacteriales bacterium]